jgi:hypothetical protein
MKIFVSICSYRDNLLHHTIESLIKFKSNRHEATYAIFEQNTIDKSLETLYPELIKRKDVKYKRIDPEYSEGVGWARHINSLQLTDEDFYYQIDSHMVFDPDWDRMLINDYREAVSKCDTNKIIISSNCKNFEIIDDTPCLQHNKRVATVAKFYQFNKNFWIYAHGEHIPATETVMPAIHVFAGNFFTHSDWLQNVGINPKIFFHGEEQIMTLASFAAGYKLFHGKEISCYHYLNANLHTSKQTVNPVVSDDILSQRALISDIEFKAFLEHLDDSVLESYKAYSGVDYINRKLEKRAITYNISPSCENDWEV